MLIGTDLTIFCKHLGKQIYQGAEQTGLYSTLAETIIVWSVNIILVLHGFTCLSAGLELMLNIGSSVTGEDSIQLTLTNQKQNEDLKVHDNKIPEAIS